MKTGKNKKARQTLRSKPPAVKDRLNTRTKRRPKTPDPKEPAPSVIQCKVDIYTNALQQVVEKCGARLGILDSNCLHQIHGTVSAAINYAHRLSAAERRTEEQAELKHLSALVDMLRKVFPDMTNDDILDQIADIRKLTDQAPGK